MVFEALWSTAAAVAKLPAAPLVGTWQFVSNELKEAQDSMRAREEARRAAAQVSDPLRAVAWPS
jgi:hypothetical protein